MTTAARRLGVLQIGALLVAGAGALCVVAGVTDQAMDRSERTVRVGGVDIRCTLVGPPGFATDGNAHPTLLALPPGDQSQAMVDRAIELYWSPEAARRGWVVVSPAAPAGGSFADGGGDLLPGLLDELGKSLAFEGGAPHLAGVSNGGRAAFRACVEHPERFASLTVLPGMLREDDVARAARLRGVPVAMFVGEQDAQWLDASRRDERALRAAGVDVTLTVAPGQGHVLNIAQGELFDLLDARRRRE